MTANHFSAMLFFSSKLQCIVSNTATKSRATLIISCFTERVRSLQRRLRDASAVELHERAFVAPVVELDGHGGRFLRHDCPSWADKPRLDGFFFDGALAGLTAEEVDLAWHRVVGASCSWTSVHALWRASRLGRVGCSLHVAPAPRSQT